MRLLLKLLPTDVTAGTRLLRWQIGLHEGRQQHFLQSAENLDLGGAHFAESVRVAPLIVHRPTGGLHLAALAVHESWIWEMAAVSLSNQKVYKPAINFGSD